MKGQVKIELFDESGEVVQEVRKDNFISKGMNPFLYNLWLSRLFMSNGSTDNKVVSNLLSPTSYLYLTDADHDEDKDNEWFIRGSLIGQAQTYGSSGLYNKAESYNTESRVRIVIDFPATEANGDINSVYFGKPPTGDLIDNSDVTVFGIQQVLYNSAATINRALFYKNRFYILFGRATTDISLSTYDENGQQLSVVTGFNNYIKDMVIVDDVIYFVTGQASSSAPDVVSYDLSITNNSVAVVDSDVKDNYTASHGYGITYNPDKDQFLIATDSGGYLDTFDRAFNKLSSRKHNLPNNGSSPGYHTAKISVIDGYVVNRDYVINDSGINTPHCICPDIPIDYDGEHVYAIGGTLNLYLYKYPKIGFTSRARLATPVTKTSTNTMKVTYDFILPSVYG